MKFISITKPGIIFGNLVTVMGGFFLGSHNQPLNLPLLFYVLLGMTFVIASGCVFNNCIDKDIDALMERTKNRVMPQHKMSTKTAIIYGILLGIVGFLVLYQFINPLTVLVAFIGIFFYVVVYSLWFKRHSVFGTVVGGIAGAVPPVAGYCAVSNCFDAGAIILFLILFFWQLPHFYAISIYRLKDFSAANLPILPLVRNINYTKINMIINIAIYTIVSILPFFFGYVGRIYFIGALSLGLIWFIFGLLGLFKNNDSENITWSRKMFLLSIINITILCVLMF
jgi:protoheme IX farnesyltransferase